MHCKYVEVHGTMQAVIERAEQTEYPHKWTKSTLTYAIIDPTEDAEAVGKLEIIIDKAVGVWQAEIPVKFVKVNSSENPDITFKFENDPNGDPYLKAGPTILAYAYFPKTIHEGVVVFNDYKYHWGDEDKIVNNEHIWNAVHVTIHELGHTLGLSHDEAEDSKDIMDPYYSGNVITLSENDQKRIHLKYGQRSESPVSFAIYPFDESRLDEIDVRLVPFVSGWKAVYTYNDQKIIIPGTWNSEFIIDRYFKIIKSPDSPNSGESENEICLVLQGGWHPFDVEVIINLFIRGNEVLDGTDKVSAEILKPSGSDIELSHNNKLVTNFKTKSWLWPKDKDKVWIENL